ncbi:FMN-binding protein [Lachnobacterium bovis]|uniref:FMN-binding domain-containing protein n=1 Tax=Lachnobacterium bovis DSM 14045 TaxID=1122142 RepID=A0A1H3FAX9_9FIRM|nr:FMN-binding protein [Lachnobacterium bovis]SDX87997.1 FMN-binding domain-containing protein [Lachnobacterium bovis DSM 14045]
MKKKIVLKGIKATLLVVSYGVVLYAANYKFDNRHIDYVTKIEVVSAKRINNKEKTVYYKNQKDVGNNSIKECIGEGKGFGGTIKVKLLINTSDLSIEKMNVLEHSKEDDSYFTMADSSISRQIVGKRLENIEDNISAVSGATYSSRGIIEAVKDAKKKYYSNH